MKKTVLPAALFVAVLAGGANAQTQPDTISTTPAEVDHIETPAMAFARSAAGRNFKIVAPGALLFASYDHNYDGFVGADEIEAGARGSFRVADVNGDGVLSGFEQSDWARLVGAADEVLANPMQFDSDLDRSVTEAEFVSGIRRLSESMGALNGGRIAIADLTHPASAERPGVAPPPPE